jgi:hypothetical protein
MLGSAGLAGWLDGLFPAGTVSRLDPPLTMVLDEVANTAPVPAAAWPSCSSATRQPRRSRRPAGLPTPSQSRN